VDDQPHLLKNLPERFRIWPCSKGRSRPKRLNSLKILRDEKEMGFVIAKEKKSHALIQIKGALDNLYSLVVGTRDTQ
jgi:hypothetical protein